MRERDATLDTYLKRFHRSTSKSNKCARMSPVRPSIHPSTRWVNLRHDRVPCWFGGLPPGPPAVPPARAVNSSAATGETGLFIATFLTADAADGDAGG